MALDLQPSLDYFEVRILNRSPKVSGDFQVLRVPVVPDSHSGVRRGSNDLKRQHCAQPEDQPVRPPQLLR